MSLSQAGLDWDTGYHCLRSSAPQNNSSVSGRKVSEPMLNSVFLDAQYHLLQGYAHLRGRHRGPAAGGSCAQGVAPSLKL